MLTAAATAAKMISALGTGPTDALPRVRIAGGRIPEGVARVTRRRSPVTSRPTKSVEMKGCTRRFATSSPLPKPMSAPGGQHGGQGEPHECVRALRDLGNRHAGKLHHGRHRQVDPSRNDHDRLPDGEDPQRGCLAEDIEQVLRLEEHGRDERGEDDPGSRERRRRGAPGGWPPGGRASCSSVSCVAASWASSISVNADQVNSLCGTSARPPTTEPAAPVLPHERSSESHG